MNKRNERNKREKKRTKERKRSFVIGIQFSKLADLKSKKVEKSGGGEEGERREKSGNHVENYERSPSMRQ